MVEKIYDASALIHETGAQVYEHLMDKESKDIYEKRVMYWMTGDRKYLQDLIRELPQTKTWDAYVKKCKPMGKDLIVYGACADYEVFQLIYPDAEFLCFCDRDVNKQKNGWMGKRVISPEELLAEYSDKPILINASDYHEEIYDFLIANGIPKENIYNKGKEIATKYPEQYFDDDIVEPVANEIFIDGGCFDLNTARRFAKWCGNDYRKIYSFEPDIESYRNCVKYNERNPIDRLELLNKGTWEKEDTLLFFMAGEGGHISDMEEETIEIQVDAIDHVAKDDAVTFIKLDVEGAELKSLQGAKETIQKNHPRLAISVYHKPEDIIEIPAYILSLCPDYKFYIRHYKFSYYETILYAV